MLGKKGSLQTRRDTFVKLHDISKQFELLIVKTNNGKFKSYLKEINDRIQFSIVNDKKLLDKDVKKMFKILNSINELFNHELWNHIRIKKKLQVVDEMVNQIITK